MANMTMQDRLVLGNWLRAKLSIAAVEAISPTGIADNVRFTPAAVRAFKLIWLWSGEKFSGEAGKRHTKAYNRLGSLAYYNRIRRFKKHTIRLQSA